MRAPTEQDWTNLIRIIRAKIATTPEGRRVTVKCTSFDEWGQLIERLKPAEAYRLDVVMTSL